MTSEALDDAIEVDRAVRAGRLPATAEGTSGAPFAPLDWALVSLSSVIWGASFLLIAEGLESMEPGVVAWLRIAFGFTALAAIPTARVAASSNGPTSPASRCSAPCG